VGGVITLVRPVTGIIHRSGIITIVEDATSHIECQIQPAKKDLEDLDVRDVLS
jgi:hypothetical protein